MKRRPRKGPLSSQLLFHLMLLLFLPVFIDPSFVVFPFQIHYQMQSMMSRLLTVQVGAHHIHISS